MVVTGLTAPSAQPRPVIRPVNTPFTTIDLVPQHAYELLERPNRIKDICGDVERNLQCVGKVLTPHTYVIHLFTAPYYKGKPAGAILMTVTPGVELTDVEYIAPNGVTTRMTPDDGVDDWGYGSPFRFTVLERQEHWIKLPRRPFPEPVWIDAQTDLGRVELESVKTGDLYTLGKRKFFTLQALAKGLRVRDEQDADMWCDGSETPAIKPFRSRDLTMNELYDFDGHFLMTMTYPKGC